MKKILLLFLMSFVMFKLYGQEQTLEQQQPEQVQQKVQEELVREMFSIKMPSKIDTIYFPFYNGVQMIEIDHLSFWDKKIFFLEQTQPRALSYDMLHPPPAGNEFIFRDSTGKVVKAFNAIQDLEQLTAHFSKISIDQKNAFPFLPPPSHKSRQALAQGVWIYSPQSMFSFKGNYKVSNKSFLTQVGPYADKPNKENMPLFGLIDSLGNIKLPVKYQEILPLKDKLIVQQNDKWGIIDYDQKNYLPFKYDHFKNFHSDPKYNKHLFFISDGKINCIYNIEEAKYYETKPYNDVMDHYVQFGYFLVQKDRFYGLIDLEGREILAPIYKRVNNVNRADCIYKNCVSVQLDGKTVDLEIKPYEK